MSKRNVCIVVAMCPHNRKFLVGKRRDGRWNFFGGRAEENELPENCAIREFKEETGIKLQSKFLRPFRVVEKKKKVIHAFFVLLHNMTRIKLDREHKTYRWLEAEQLAEKKLNGNTKSLLRAIDEVNV